MINQKTFLFSQKSLAVNICLHKVIIKFGFYVNLFSQCIKTILTPCLCAFFALPGSLTPFIQHSTEQLLLTQPPHSDLFMISPLAQSPCASYSFYFPILRFQSSFAFAPTLLLSSFALIKGPLRDVVDSAVLSVPFFFIHSALD